MDTIDVNLRNQNRDSQGMTESKQELLLTRLGGQNPLVRQAFV